MHVFATHPQMKNYSGHARGRVLHLSDTSKKGALTFCKMAVDSKADDIQKNGRRVCKVCANLNPKNKEDIQ